LFLNVGTAVSSLDRRDVRYVCIEQRACSIDFAFLLLLPYFPLFLVFQGGGDEIDGSVSNRLGLRAWRHLGWSTVFFLCLLSCCFEPNLGGLNQIKHR